MKKILGLDLGTNSIGWALIDVDDNGKPQKIEGLGSRIIPMTQDVLDTFTGGKPLETQTAARTAYRGVRRIRERHLLRRERLHRVLNGLGFLPEHYARQIDFNKHLGQFIEDSEPKISYDNNGFIFKKTFEEMLSEFKQFQPQLFYAKQDGKETKIPYDWTIYFLRKKALTQKIDKEELAWIILNFNQKRGYYQLRGEEEEENPGKLVEFHSLKVIDVIADEKPNSKGDTWYSLHLENGWIYRRSSKTPLFDWKDKVRDFIVTSDLNEDGTIKTDKDGNEKRSFRAPSENDWTLLKKKTEKEIDKSKKTVGTYIYDTLLANPSQKIRGKLVRTIERKYYKAELVAILKKQIALQPELFSENLYNDCVRELYRNNDSQQIFLSKRDFVHLFVEDIIFYQRPLRSQKSSIGNCPLEYREYKDSEGNKVKEYLKVIHKSHPLYQEFRVWQWISNLRIYKKDDDSDVTAQFLKSNEDVENVFDFLMQQKEVGHKDILKFLIAPILKIKYPNVKATAFNKEVDNEISKYRWNYVFDDSKEKEEEKSKKYPCNNTAYEIRRRLEKVADVPSKFLTPDIEQHLWHIIYSVTDKKEFISALKNFARRHSLNENSFVSNFEKFPPFKSEYGAYSEKAIKKFLPLMRMGKYWNWNEIDSKTQARIRKIITGEFDENIKNRVREKAINLTDENHFKGLPVWLAGYVIYDRHSEADFAVKWESVAELEKYLKDFKQHDLRNPIVEQVVTETLRVVRDIWKKYGSGTKDFFREIHVELGREMKNTADDRKRLTEQVTKNEATNLRIKALLMELKENSDGTLPVDNVRPHSPMQQDALRIYEDGVLNSKINLPEDIVKISKTAQPTKSELQRYKLWLEQKYRSPYTGEIIPLGRLFTEDYQIEHIIPKSRYFDDSFNNKVICESAVNQLKDKQLGMEFIKNNYGQKVELGFGKTVKIFTEDSYKEFIKENYSKNKAKRQNLLLEDIPEQMIARQMNDTRYISKYISGLLSNIVRQDKDDDGINSKMLIPGNGKITSALKKDWGLDAVWNDLILPRFERMNQLTNCNDFTYWNEQHKKFLPVDYSPVDSKRIEKKRIDHRHHAMDALVLACMTRDHVNLLNNQSAKSESTRYDLQNKLRNKSKETLYDRKIDKHVERDVFKEFKKPWENFTIDAKSALENVVVSFKQNLRVINKATNNYQKWIEKDGKKVKAIVKQEGVNWAIRKPIHKETVAGIVNLRFKKSVQFAAAIDQWEMLVDKNLKTKIKQLINEGFDKKKIINFFKKNNFRWMNKDISKPEINFFSNDEVVMVASRTQLDVSFNEKKIESITDKGIQQILIKHLHSEKYQNKIDDTGKSIPAEQLAFSPEGIEDLNKNILNLNNGKFHKQIFKVRTYEPKGNKFSVGYKGNKHKKFVETATGTNLFFAIYVNELGKRSFETIPLNIVIERLKQGFKEVPETNLNGDRLLFFLSPNDLVYVPTDEEIETPRLNKQQIIENPQIQKFYKVEKFSGVECYFIRNDISSLIKQYDSKSKFGELESQNKLQTTMCDRRIKIVDFCYKLKIDRLGNVTEIFGIR